MATLIIAIILVVILIWIFFTPFILRIDTESHTYQVSFGMLVRAWVDSDKSELIFHFKIPWYHFRKKLTDIGSGTSKEKKKAKSRSASFRQLKRYQNVIRSFRLTDFYTALDTDDYSVNAQLFPIGLFLTNKGYPTYINFQGRSRLTLEIQNTLWRMATAYTNFKKY